MELYINSILVDLNEKIPFPLTFAISDIKDDRLIGDAAIAQFD